MALKCIRAGAFCLSKTGGQLVKIPGRSGETNRLRLKHSTEGKDGGHGRG